MNGLIRLSLLLVVCCGASAFFTSNFALQSSRSVQTNNGLYMFFGGKSATKTVKKTGFAITVEQKGKKPVELTIEGSEKVNLRKTLLEKKVDLYPLKGKFSNCGGGGACGTCAVAVLDGDKNLSPKAPVEKKLLAGKPENFRLACCTRVTGDCTIQTKP
mmetsp:Transcript_20483/g.27004  ORF Transcript_20483/g.27004 Transcript_20483/m.27004 type:complete len:159 (-) Transcript_20483:501-977(-)